MSLEESIASAQITQIRYVFREPDNEELHVVFEDMISGFQVRSHGHEDIVELVGPILGTFAFAD